MLKPRTITGTHDLSVGPFPDIRAGETAARLRELGVRERPREFVRELQYDYLPELNSIRYEFVLGSYPAPSDRQPA